MDVNLLMMADKLKTDNSGKCLLCESVPPVLEVVQCYFCKGCFPGRGGSTGVQRVRLHHSIFKTTVNQASIFTGAKFV